MFLEKGLAGSGWRICCHCSPFSTSVSIRVSFRENSWATSLNKHKQKSMSQHAKFLFFIVFAISLWLKGGEVTLKRMGLVTRVKWTSYQGRKIRTTSI